MGRAELAEMVGDLEGAADCHGDDGKPIFSQWEREFTESVAGQLGRRGRLSEAQADKAGELWDKT